MSHFDHLRPSYGVFICALVFGLVAAYTGPNGVGFALFSCALIGWGIVINARENERDKRLHEDLTSGLADLLIDQQTELAHRMHAESLMESMETMPGGRRYYGVFPHLSGQHELLVVDTQEE